MSILSSFRLQFSYIKLLNMIRWIFAAAFESDYRMLHWEYQSEILLSQNPLTESTPPSWLISFINDFFCLILSSHYDLTYLYISYQLSILNEATWRWIEHTCQRLSDLQLYPRLAQTHDDLQIHVLSDLQLGDLWLAVTRRTVTIRKRFMGYNYLLVTFCHVWILAKSQTDKQWAHMHRSLFVCLWLGQNSYVTKSH